MKTAGVLLEVRHNESWISSYKSFRIVLEKIFTTESEVTWAIFLLLGDFKAFLCTLCSCYMKIWMSWFENPTQQSEATWNFSCVRSSVNILFSFFMNRESVRCCQIDSGCIFVIGAAAPVCNLASNPHGAGGNAILPSYRTCSVTPPAPHITGCAVWIKGILRQIWTGQISDRPVV